MKSIKHFILIMSIFTGAAFSQTPVIVTINTSAKGIEIPEDFAGFSFGTGLLPKSATGYVFDSTNKQMLKLFSELGIKHLRIGGTSVDRGPMPKHEDIDALFRFVNASGVKTVYSLRLANGDALQDASDAKYVWDNYRQYLDCFSIGNEPNYIEGRNDPEIRDYESWHIKWERFAKAILDSVPEAKFGGPDPTTTPRGITWGPKFARDEAKTSYVKAVFYHYYVGSDVNGKTAQQVIDAMLSKEWITTNYPERFDTTAAVAARYKIPYRLTEANSYCGVPVEGGNNSFATALFSLDFMYWWASHECPGLDFHCTMPKLNTTIYVDSNGNYQVNPMAYGIKAFNIGGHGKIVPVKVSNTDPNMTAYAVVNKSDMFVTIINKEHGENAKDLTVNIEADNSLGKAEAMFLTSPGNDVKATKGVTLGSEVISNDKTWNGKWTSLDSKESGSVNVLIPASTAVIVKIQLNK